MVCGRRVPVFHTQSSSNCAVGRVKANEFARTEISHAIVSIDES